MTAVFFLTLQIVTQVHVYDTSIMCSHLRFRCKRKAGELSGWLTIQKGICPGGVYLTARINRVMSIKKKMPFVTEPQTIHVLI